MSVETRLMFTDGLLKPIQVKAGALAKIASHREMLTKLFDLGDDPRDWSLTIERKLNTRGVPSSRLSRVPARDDDVGMLTDDHAHEIAEAHRTFLDAMWEQFRSDRKLEGEIETITVEQAAEFWPLLTLSIEVPFWRWSAEHYHEQMIHAYEVMRGRDSHGEHFDAEPLSIAQAKAVVLVFSRWMDEHDIRLDVPNGHDDLARSDTGEYDWCEHCGAIGGDEVEHTARTCARASECPLRRLFSDDHFDDETEERE